MGPSLPLHSVDGTVLSIWYQRQCHVHHSKQKGTPICACLEMWSIHVKGWVEGRERNEHVLSTYYTPGALHILVQGDKAAAEPKQNFSTPDSF